VLDLRKTLQLAHQTFQKNGVAHALIGGFALSVYGVNRATSDIDFLVDGNKKSIAKATLIEAGFTLWHESNETLQFKGIGRVDLILANRPLSLEMLTQAKSIERVGVHVVSPEGLIALKIQAYSNDKKMKLKDLSDIQAVIEKNDDSLDWAKIRQYADLFGEWKTIQELRNNYVS
jgi:hypothetical protein